MLVAEQLEPVFRDLEMPLIPVLVAVEHAGILVDTSLLAQQSRHLEQELASHTARIFELAG
jgi:DNA polymerase-1